MTRPPEAQYSQGMVALKSAVPGRAFFVMGLLLGMLLALALLVAGLGVRATRQLFVPSGRAVLQAFGAMREQHLTQTSPDLLAQGATEGMIRSSGDSYTHYFAPSAAVSLQDSTDGLYTGIGIDYRVLKGSEHSVPAGAVLTFVETASPAEQQGLHVGEVLVRIGGQGIAGWSEDKIGEALQGKAEQPVTLTLWGHAPGSSARPVRQVKVVRQRRAFNPVTVHEWPGGVRSLGLYSFFGAQTAEQFRQALKLPHAGGLVLDLRDNPGGRVEQAAAVADQLLTAGPIVTTRDRQGRVQVLTRASAQPTDDLGPLVVLTNRQTASAAEILAAALQARPKTLLIGERTFGKGVANVRVPLANGGELMLSVTEWLTPSGQSVLSKGVQPNVKLPDTRFQPGGLGQDPMMDAALKWLKQQQK